MMDLFNVFHTSNILTHASGNVSQANSTAPASIIPPRVPRFGLRASSNQCRNSTSLQGDGARQSDRHLVKSFQGVCDPKAHSGSDKEY